MSNINIVIIHDDWNESTTAIVELKDIYGDQNVVLIKQSEKGIQYILDMPPRKTIVLLDYNFKTGEPTGGEVFRKIREKSSLIYIIIVTKSEFRDIKIDDFVEFVNNHALAIARPNHGYMDIINLVDVARHQLDVRVDVILEQWISEKSKEDLDKPYLTSYDGKQYSLGELLYNIRQQTKIGKEFEVNILKLAIELVMKKFQKHD